MNICSRKTGKLKAPLKSLCCGSVEKTGFFVCLRHQLGSKPGEHWIAVYFKNRGRGEYFDSYGLPPTFISRFT